MNPRPFPTICGAGGVVDCEGYPPVGGGAPWLPTPPPSRRSETRLCWNMLCVVCCSGGIKFSDLSADEGELRPAPSGCARARRPARRPARSCPPAPLGAAARPRTADATDSARVHCH
ncbi:Protein of unknown function [Gryllus bimaculatus]|nr:Protein of unknown function [Gryllus bimaculatus]